MTSTRSTSTNAKTTNTKTRSATRRIESFRQRFGEGHVYLACHAALPLALTPDLLYSLWANFQRDIHDDAIEIPWIAVANLLLSNLCKEVGNELYEMDQAVRDDLLKQLQNDSRFGLERLQALADFVMAYVEQQLDSPDLDVRDLATGQQWRALTYKNPSEAAHSIAIVLAQLSFDDRAEWIRMAALLNSLAEPLSAFQPLLNYIRAMADLARGNLAAATDQMTQAVDANNQVQVEGVNLPIPDVLNGTLPKSQEPDVLPTSPPNKLKMPIVIAGGTIISALILIGMQYGLKSPTPKPSPVSSATPTPQSSSSSAPTPQPSAQKPFSSPSPAIPQTTKPQQALPAIPQGTVASQPQKTPTQIPDPSQLTPAPNRERFIQPQPILPTPTAEPSPQLKVTRIEVTGTTILGAQELNRIMQPLENRTVTLEELRSAADSITQLYIDRGYITSVATLIDQTVSNGVVQIRVVEGSLERIDVEGTQNVDPEYIRQIVQKGVSVPLNQNSLETQLQLLKTDPKFTNVEAKLTTGSQLGQSILTVRVIEADGSKEPGVFDLIPRDPSSANGRARGRVRGPAVR